MANKKAAKVVETVPAVKPEKKVKKAVKPAKEEPKKAKRAYVRKAAKVEFPPKVLKMLEKAAKAAALEILVAGLNAPKGKLPAKFIKGVMAKYLAVLTEPLTQKVKEVAKEVKEAAPKVKKVKAEKPPKVEKVKKEKTPKVAKAPKEEKPVVVEKKVRKAKKVVEAVSALAETPKVKSKIASLKDDEKAGIATASNAKAGITNVVQ